MLVYSIMCFQLNTLDLHAHPSQHCMTCIVCCTICKVSDLSSDIVQVHVPAIDMKPICAATSMHTTCSVENATLLNLQSEGSDRDFRTQAGALLPMPPPSSLQQLLVGHPQRQHSVR